MHAREVVELYTTIARQSTQSIEETHNGHLHFKLFIVCILGVVVCKGVLFADDSV